MIDISIKEHNKIASSVLFWCMCDKVEVVLFFEFLLSQIITGILMIILLFYEVFKEFQMKCCKFLKKIVIVLYIS